MFPQRLDSPLAYDIAKAMMDGFNRHYRLFRSESARAKHRFETADWHGQQRAQRERIEFYDLRVKECVMRLEKEFKAGAQPMDVWHQVKLHYIGLLVNHLQPELAETFFNSVTTKILHRTHFHNNFIFVRPAVSTEYIENDEPAAKPTYRAYYPTRETLLPTIVSIVENFHLQHDFEDLPRDAAYVLEAISERLAQVKLRANFQIQVLSSLFFRNKGAYVVGKIINGFAEVPFSLPLLHSPKNGKLLIDATLFGEDDLQALFSFARAYFMVDMDVPSAYVQFLRSLMPRKPRNELYNALGLAKQGKTLFYRDFLYHLRHSSDSFRIAPGIKGMVMLVFDLPSFPYVFKLIKDYYPPQKDTTRIIKHLYIERRMIPLNIYLKEAFDTGLDDATARGQVEGAVLEYGNAIKDLVAANIFPGDMLWKNFGVTRHGKVVFYDYDEIEYLTDCNFRRVPTPRNEEDEMSGEVWYSVGPRDVFPETFAPFLLGNDAVRAVFMKHHADLLDVAFWQGHKERIQAGHVHDVFPYERERRFSRLHAPGASGKSALAGFPPEPRLAGPGGLRP